MLQSPREVVGFGALNCDMICKVDKIPSPGQEVGVISVERQPGGSAANTIVGLARLGIRTGFLGAVGDDITGEQLISDLQKEHVDVHGVDRLNGNTGTALAFIDAKGERTIYVLPSVNDDYALEHFDYLRDVSILHISSFVNPEQLRVQVACAMRAKAQGTQVSFSPGNVYTTLGLEQLRSLIKAASIVFLNDEESQTLTGLAYEESADDLLHLGAQTVIITRGSSGCYIATKREHLSVPAFKTAIQDTIGAGDAFAAGFLYGELRRASLYQSGLYGNYLASKCVTELGARKGLTFSAEELAHIEQK